MSSCPHMKITIVDTKDKEVCKGGFAVALLVRCSDCGKELYRNPIYGKKVTNLLPN